MHTWESRTVLELRSLCVSYGPVDAVKSLDIVVRDREAVALLGPNGAGKTSTLRAVSQLQRFTGSVIFDGVDLRGRKPEDVARAGLVHVPEGRRLFASLTVHENLQMGETARSGRAPSYSISDVYDLFPALRPLARRLGYALSGGEQQMVAIGRALVASPRFLLLDEPSLGLAPIVTKVVFAVLAEVGTRTPMLVVEQNTAIALNTCSRGYVLVSGRIGMSGTSEEMTDREGMLASYLGQHDAVVTP
ncbi:MAG: transporter ATP-binding protein [Actinomycetia bacterium]|nr:transporter ATP-binding protein [Actinomycetes bacterium]